MVWRPLSRSGDVGIGRPVKKGDGEGSAATRRPVIVLYSERDQLIDHCVRMVLKEKEINVEIQFVDDECPPELEGQNPYGKILTLIDRDLVLYEANIIMEYLDDRYPHPPLLPIEPGGRARNRQLRYRIREDMYSLAARLDSDNEIKAASAKRILRDHLTTIAPMFAHRKYFLSDEFTLVDCCMAPLLWRLTHYGIKLPPSARSLQAYGRRMFKRPSFARCLSDVEKEYRRL